MVVLGSLAVVLTALLWSWRVATFARRETTRLVPLEGGRTLLEATTWYHHHLWPADYWQLWSDHIIHTIHLRVLRHVKQLSEAGEKP
jgi:hypothetical protein